MKRLHLKLYFAVVGTLMVFTVAAALIWHFFAPRESMWGVQSASGVAALVFESQPPTGAQEDAMLEAMSYQLHADVALYAVAGTVPLKTRGWKYGYPTGKPGPDGWQITRQGPLYLRTLADGRRLVIHPRQRFLLHGLHLGLLLVSVAVALALIIYPITRGITARLERLKTGVRELGEGNLAARVAVEGQDEVAALARGFNESAARVEKLVAAHKLLLANCSHELRTPLARIRLAIEKISASAPAETAEMARSISELDALIGEMLLASRLDALRRPERQEEVDLLALVAEEATYFGLEPAGVPLTVIGDPALLRRMVRNLLDNAKRHGGGATRVEVQRAHNRAEIRIEDQGPGIAPADRERIFEPFQRVSGPSSGTGLGLSIVRQVARAHGGDVSVETSGPAGARFIVSLPATAATG